MAQKESAAATALGAAWAKQGAVVTVKPFDKITKNQAIDLAMEAQKWDNNAVIKGAACDVQRLLTSSKSLKDVERNAPCRKMLLESAHNDLARAAELHLKRKYNCKLVYGASRESNSSSLQSVMTCIDNVPDDYPLKFVTRALLHKLVTDWKSMSRVLKRHLDKSKRSYQKLVLDLSKDQKMNAATDFYVAGLRVLYDIPILLVQPHKITHPSGETDYVFKEEYCIDGDEILNPCDFRIRLLFNGLNHYTPFYPAEIADIINDGRPLAKNIINIYSQVKDIRPRIPKNSSLYNTMNQMYRLSRSAAFLAQSCKFSCGQGDVADMMDIPTPVPEPLETPETRRPQHPTSTATSSSQPPTTQPATTQPATTQPTTSQGVVVPGAAAPASQPTASQDDCKMAENQCYCGQFFESDDAKNDHIAIIHASDTWACGASWTNNVGVEGFCTHVAKDRFQLWTHFRKVHKQKYKHHCPEPGCTVRSDEQWVIDKHMSDMHNAPKLHCCHKCGKDFGKKRTLREHLEICQVDKSVKPYKCESCPKGYRSKDELRRHIGQEHPSTEGDTSGWYFCPDCGKKYGTVSGRRKHMAKEHT